MRVGGNPQMCIYAISLNCWFVSRPSSLFRPVTGDDAHDSEEDSEYMIPSSRPVTAPPPAEIPPVPRSLATPQAQIQASSSNSRYLHPPRGAALSTPWSFIDDCFVPLFVNAILGQHWLTQMRHLLCMKPCSTCSPGHNKPQTQVFWTSDHVQSSASFCTTLTWRARRVGTLTAVGQHISIWEQAPTLNTMKATAIFKPQATLCACASGYDFAVQR